MPELLLELLSEEIPAACRSARAVRSQRAVDPLLERESSALRIRAICDPSTSDCSGGAACSKQKADTHGARFGPRKGAPEAAVRGLLAKPAGGQSTTTSSGGTTGGSRSFWSKSNTPDGTPEGCSRSRYRRCWRVFRGPSRCAGATTRSAGYVRCAASSACSTARWCRSSSAAARRRHHPGSPVPRARADRSARLRGLSPEAGGRATSSWMAPSGSGDRKRGDPACARGESAPARRSGAARRARRAGRVAGRPAWPDRPALHGAAARKSWSPRCAIIRSTWRSRTLTVASRRASSRSPISRPRTMVGRSSQATSACCARVCGTRSSSGTRTASGRWRAGSPELDGVVFHARLGSLGDKAGGSRSLPAGSRSACPRPRPSSRPGQGCWARPIWSPAWSASSRSSRASWAGITRCMMGNSRGRGRDRRALRAAGPERSVPERPGQRRRRARRQARQPGRLLCDRREAKRLKGPVRAAPRRARRHPADPGEPAAAAPEGRLHAGPCRLRRSPA